MVDTTIDTVDKKNITIKNKMYIITWDPWSWKSIFASMLCSTYSEIWSNLNITYNWKNIVNTIKNIEDIAKVRFSEKKWVILLEEMWVNANSRRSFSEENMIFSELAMLGRKLNKDIFYIAQIRRTVDVNLRDLTLYEFQMNSWLIGTNYPMFSVTVRDRGDNILWVKELDLIAWQRASGIGYDSLETSRIEKKKKPSKIGSSNLL